MACIWKHIPEINCYISNDGQIKNCNNKVLKTMFHRGSKYEIIQRRDKLFHIHELVAHYFIAKPYNRYDDPIIHIDGNKKNNTVSNLKYKFVKRERTVSKEESEKFIITFKDNNGKIHVANSEDESIVLLDKMPFNGANFTMLNHMDNNATDEDLLKYVVCFKQWIHELKNNDIIKIDYVKLFTDNLAVTKTFERLCKRFYESHEIITPLESYWMERCSNCGLQYFDDTYKDVEIECVSYDYKNQYGLCMTSDTLIPTKQGKECKLLELPKLSKNLLPGYYKVKIVCTDPDFKKMFCFNRYNVYVNTSLAFAMKLKKKYNISISLVDEDVNAYLYNPSDTVTCKSVMSNWFNKLTTLRKQFPQNRLLKNLISSCWGRLSQYNTIIRTLESIKEEKLNVGRELGVYDYTILEKNCDNDNNQYYRLLNNLQPYKFNIRLKPYVTACSRIMIAEVIMSDVKNVVRVQTDSVTFIKVNNEVSEGFDYSEGFDDENLVIEDKTTGKIKFSHVNKYFNITTGYKTKNYDLKVKEDEEEI